MKISEYQELAVRSDRTGSDQIKSLMITLLGLAGESGSLLSEYKKWLREGEAYKPFTHHASEEIGDVLWYLANLASKLNLDLGEIASENIAKLEDWKSNPLASTRIGDPCGGRRYDSTYPPAEQLPKTLRIQFIEEPASTGSRLRLKLDDREIGDPLTDNSYIDDGYRYHDVFHIGCAILLGWSPVMRRILRVKRKSVPQVDIVEDGARALVTEEGVSAVVFGYARDFSMFQSSTEIDYEVLRTIKGMVWPFEVRTKSLADWENAILKSYEVWRKLIEHNGGVVAGDAEAGVLTFEPLGH